MTEKVAQCKRCKESIKLGASVCKTCGQEQGNFVYWLKQVGTSIALLATVVSVAISTAAFIRSSQVPTPEARLAITNWTANFGESILKVEILNFGTAPASITNFLVNYSRTYDSGGGERYSGGIPVGQHESIAAGDYHTIEIDLTKFASRGGWQGSLHDADLPDEVRVPLSNETVGGSTRYSYSSSCNITLITRGVNGRDDWSNRFENAGSICSAIKPYAIEYFSRLDTFSRK